MGPEKCDRWRLAVVLRVDARHVAKDLIVLWLPRPDGRLTSTSISLLFDLHTVLEQGVDEDSR